MDALFSQWAFKEESARTSPRAERDDSVAERQLLELTARAKQKRDGHVEAALSDELSASRVDRDETSWEQAGGVRPSDAASAAAVADPPREASSSKRAFEAHSRGQPAAKCARQADARLAELSLIRAYRAQSRASVDDFHAFLVEQTGAEGRYWALVACLLSVQCRDAVSLGAARALQRRAPRGAVDVGALSLETLEELCASCNYYKTKASNIAKVTSAVLGRFGGDVPRTYKGLVSLPGVGPKIAHLMSSVAFGAGDGTGIVVDTHVHRVARKLGWVDAEEATRRGPEETRKQLEHWVPRGEWTDFSLAVVGFGQFTQRAGQWWRDFLLFVAREHGGEDSPQSELAASIVARMKDELEEEACAWGAGSS